MPERIIQRSIMDPSKSSLREEAFRPEFKTIEDRFPVSLKGKSRKTPVYIDQKTGEKFHKLETNLHKASFQKLTALMLKGVVNVSDVLKIGSDYFSHEQDFEKIESSNRDVIVEMKADFFILRRIFGDQDHAYYPANNIIRVEAEKQHPTSPAEHKNLLIDESKGKINFFDFHRTGLEYMATDIEDPSRLENMFKSVVSKKDKTVGILKKKVRLLISSLSDFGRFRKIWGRIRRKATRNFIL
ncbi:MAG: hypothetical protein WCI76_03090 [bacterium]